MKFLLAQINPVVGDLEGNAKKILNAASKASSNSADLVLTPELSLWGYPANDLLLKKNLIENQYQILDQLALDVFKKYGNLSVTVGIAEIPRNRLKTQSLRHHGIVGPPVLLHTLHVTNATALECSSGRPKCASRSPTWTKICKSFRNHVFFCEMFFSIFFIYPRSNKNFK